jgi:hypothetical protein
MCAVTNMNGLDMATEASPCHPQWHALYRLGRRDAFDHALIQNNAHYPIQVGQPDMTVKSKCLHDQ